MKCKINKRSTVDRIEVCFNKHYKSSPIIEMCISNITEKDIIEFLQILVTQHGQVSAKEMERIYQIIHGVLNYARDMEYKCAKLYDWQMIKRNIPQNKIIKEKKSETALSKMDISILMREVIQNKVYPLKQSACLCLCLNFYLGLRVGELSALKFSDFDLLNRTVSITRSDSKSYERNEDGERIGTMQYQESTTKTVNSVRIIPLLPEAVYIYELIKAHHKNCGYNSPFLVYDGTCTIRLRSLDRTLRRLCSLCGISCFNSHLIRKTFASTLHHNGVPTRVISDLMGHSEMSTTERSYILSYADNFAVYYRYMKDSLNYTIE